MPKSDKFKKQCYQPSVANIFTGNNSATSSSAILTSTHCESPQQWHGTTSLTPAVVPKGLDLSELTEDNLNFTPVNKNRRKKRRWDTGDSADKS